MADPEAAPLLAPLTAAGLSPEEALARFRILFLTVHGYASLLANNALAYDPEAARALLRQLGAALIRTEEGDPHE